MNYPLENTNGKPGHLSTLVPSTKHLPCFFNGHSRPPCLPKSRTKDSFLQGPSYCIEAKLGKLELVRVQFPEVILLELLIPATATVTIVDLLGICVNTELIKESKPNAIHAEGKELLADIRSPFGGERARTHVAVLFSVNLRAELQTFFFRP